MALPGFHALSSSDTMGCSVGKGNLSYWKAFCSADENVLDALSTLGTNITVPDVIMEKLEYFICQVFQNKTNKKTLAELRWWLFSTKQKLGEQLPPTRGAFEPAVRRSNFQAFIWERADQQYPIIPSPAEHGWLIENGCLVPVMCDLPCAPETLLQLIKCSCTKSRCSHLCKCFANNLKCTAMCGCGGDEEFCDNVQTCFNNTDSEKAIIVTAKQISIDFIYNTHFYRLF